LNLLKIKQLKMLVRDFISTIINEFEFEAGYSIKLHLENICFLSYDEDVKYD